MIRLTQIAVAALVVTFLVGPQLAILPLAFNDSLTLSYPVTEYSLRWFRDMADNPVWRQAVVNSIIIGLSSAAVATIVGTAAALGLRDRHGLYYRLLRGLFVLPMVVPIVLLGVGMQIAFAPFGLTNGYAGVILGHAVISVPFVIASVSSALAGINPLLERAAASLGARPVATFGFVTAPLALPGILTGFVFAFAISLDEVILTLFLAGPNQRTVAREIFSQLRDNLSPTIAAVAFVIIVATICGGLLAFFLKGRNARLGLKEE